MPKHSLQGLTTDSGWEITTRLTDELASGGNFCARYIANKNGRIGFLKAMDLHSAMNDIRQIQKLVNEYVFEQDITQFCADRKMTRVVTPFDAGEIEVPNFDPPTNIAYYVIFEKAEGDLRSAHLAVESSERKWLPSFKALHHVAIGIDQLHRAQIAHQDIKPSNVLAFDELSFKISDLGRVVDGEGKSPFSDWHYPGDHTYKPLEMFFGVQSIEFVDRLACDMYMVGSLIYHVVEDIQLNSVVLDEMNRTNPEALNYPYHEALPYIETAFAQSLKSFREDCLVKFGEPIANQLHLLVSQMCNPDYMRRGNPSSTHRVDQLQLNRYIGRLDTVYRKLSVQGIE